MKTPMEELLIWAKTPNTEDNAISIITKIEQLIEKEKQVIIEANYKGLIKAQDDFPLADLQAEQYYAETFKK